MLKKAPKVPGARKKARAGGPGKKKMMSSGLKGNVKPISGKRGKPKGKVS